MKVGDKVRFLNAVGGGIVKKFQGKDVVLVEEEDGFETPVLIRECILVDSADLQVKSSSKNAIQTVEVQSAEIRNQKEKSDKIVELPGGDKLNIHLVFLPVDIKQLGKCNYEAFIVNDSNYFLYLNYMNRENNAWNSRFMDFIEPNTQLFVEEFAKEDLNLLEHICVQFLAYKKDKPFMLKNPQSVEIRLNGVKFYKLHSFKENDFFEDDAMVYPIMVNDVPAKEILISAADIQQAMNQKTKIDRPIQSVPKRKNDTKSVVEVDLHINELLDTTAGLNNTDMLNVQLKKFRETMEQYKSKKGQKIVFIHGKGEGVLRNAVLQELKTKYKNYPYQDASFKEYGFGATMVTIK